MKVIWGGPIVGTTVVEGFVDGFVDTIVGGANVGFDDGAVGGDEGKLVQPSNTAINGSAKVRTRKKSLKDFIYSAK